MAYIGNTYQTQAFTPAIDYFSGDGSTTAFTLSKPVASVQQLLVIVANVPQNPSSAYGVNGNTITFTSAPPSGTNNIWIEYTSPITQVSLPPAGWTPPAGFSEFASGTRLLFQQTAAPTGWTKDTTYTESALRITSGSVSSGGSVNFSTAFSASNTVDGTAITTAQLPAHNHPISDPGHGHSINDPTHTHGYATITGGGAIPGGSGFGLGTFSTGASGTGISINGNTTGISTTNTGSGSAHNHTLTNLAVKYVDAIICSKT